MKNAYLLTTTLALILTAGVAHAYDGYNSVYLQQTGQTGDTATINQYFTSHVGSADTPSTQSGSNDSLTVNQNTGGSLQSNQSGDDETIKATQYYNSQVYMNQSGKGDAVTMYMYGPGELGQSTASINQTGANDRVSINDGSGNVSLQITQAGDTDTANVAQKGAGLGADTMGSTNIAILNQQGKQDYASLTQVGAVALPYTALEDGEGNGAAISQFGTNDRATVSQSGADGAVVVQSGNTETVMLTQYEADQAYISQSGIGDQVTLTQKVGDIANITQSGPSNVVSLGQSGIGHNVTITQH